MTAPSVALSFEMPMVCSILATLCCQLCEVKLIIISSQLDHSVADGFSVLDDAFVARENPDTASWKIELLDGRQMNRIE
jgi:hypothetical protein